MESYKLFTLNCGVEEGAVVTTFKLKNIDLFIPAIVVGEEGRGRKLGVLPVRLLPNTYNDWKLNGKVTIYFASISQTKSGRPKLIEQPSPTTTDKCICIFRTKIGFRGSNAHTGDREDWYWYVDHYIRNALRRFHEGREEDEDVKRLYFALVERGIDPTNLNGVKFSDAEAEYIRKETIISYLSQNIIFKEFPGDVLVEGTIAQGDAGRMGSGTQLVAIIPKDVVFRTSYRGRLYGAPSAHYYKFDGTQILCATWEERQISDIF